MEPRAQQRNGKRPAKVISFGNANTPKYGITQRDLAEERFFTIEAAKALKQLETKRERIRRAIENGAIIEPGLRSADLVTIDPKPYSVNPKPYKKLVVR